MYGAGINAIFKAEMSQWTAQLRSGATIATLDTAIVQWATQCMVLESLKSSKQKDYNEQHNVEWCNDCNIRHINSTLDNTMYGDGIIATLKTGRLQWATQCVVVQTLQSLMQ